MKKILLCACLLTGMFSFGQLSGDIKRDNRQLLDSPNFVIEGNQDGKLIFDIAVDIEGNITGIKFIAGESSVKSTPARMKAQQYLADWKFEKGTTFPKFHQGRVTITMVKPL
jgi:hypothetical protein